MFLDQETILDDTFVLYPGGHTTNLIDTGAPHALSQSASGGASEGHYTYLRFTIRDAVEGGDPIRLSLQGNTTEEDATFKEIIGVDKAAAELPAGAVVKIPVPADCPRFLRAQCDLGTTPPTAGVACVDFFHG